VPPSIVIDVNLSEPVTFRVATTDAAPFTLNSFLIADSRGVPLWGFVREALVPVHDFEFIAITLGPTGVSGEAGDALTRRIKTSPRAYEHSKPQYVIAYGQVPGGYEQNVPKSGSPELTEGSSYRAVVFASNGGTSVLFRR
jgi:hypothetical protein